MLVRDADGAPQYLEGFLQDVTRRKEAEATLEATHRRLLTASRQAGMAEIATGVLHNVGNVLNSVGVSLSLVQERVRQSRVDRVGLSAELLKAHEGDLAGFLQDDPQGRQLVSYLGELGQHLSGEQKLLLAELENAGTHLAHITTIVAMQQRYATAGGVVEQVQRRGAGGGRVAHERRGLRAARRGNHSRIPRRARHLHPAAQAPPDPGQPREQREVRARRTARATGGWSSASSPDATVF